MNGRAVDRAQPETKAWLHRMYPSPHRIRHTSSDAPRVRYIAVPTARSPRVLADDRLPGLVARAVRGQAPAQKVPMRLVREVLSGVARAGLYRYIPGTSVSVHGPNDAPSIEDPLRAVLSVPEVRLAMSFGPRRANRKPVLQVVDEAGTVLAFAKVGHNALTQALVRREAECLTAISSHSWSAVVAPDKLGLVEWNGLTILVQSPLVLPRERLSGSAARECLVQVIDDISIASGRSETTWAASPLRQRLLDRLSSAGRVGEPWLARVLALPSELTVATGAWHGDLNPGNVALTTGRCPVWDWERYETGVPLGFDALHHDLQDALTRQGKEPVLAAQDLVRSAPSLLAPFGHDRAQADLVCRAYLITLADRYLADDQEGAGARLGAVHDWLLPALSGTSS